MTRLLAAIADTGPVVVLAVIAAAGSFTHIRDTAAEHGQTGWMAWAIAVCIDLTCVMAARERQRDKRTRRATGRVSWPTVVLVGGILLSLAANLAQADPTPWGWVTAATPAGAFLVAVSMLERRSTRSNKQNHRHDEGHQNGRDDQRPGSGRPAVMKVPPSFGRAEPSPAPLRRDDGRPELAAAVPARLGKDDGQDQQTTLPVLATSGEAASSSSSSRSSSTSLLEFARRVATEHHATHGRPITRDALRARLGVSNQLASDLLRQIRAEHP